MVRFSLSPKLERNDRRKNMIEDNITPFKYPKINPKKRLTGESPVFFIIRDIIISKILTTTESKIKITKKEINLYDRVESVGAKISPNIKVPLNVIFFESKRKIGLKNVSKSSITK